MTNLGSGYKHIHKVDETPTRNNVHVTKTQNRMSFDQPWKYGNNRSKSQTTMEFYKKTEMDNTVSTIKY